MAKLATGSESPNLRKALAEVEDLLNTDPAIKSGRLAYDIRPWYTAPTGSFVPGKPEKS